MTNELIPDNIMKMYENELDKLKYPIIVELPENYWESSHDIEYVVVESK